MTCPTPTDTTNYAALFFTSAAVIVCCIWAPLIGLWLWLKGVRL